MKLTTRVIGAAAVLMTLAIIPAGADAPASDQSFQALIMGTASPSTMKLKELDGTWRRLTLGGTMDSGHWLQVVSSYLGTPNPNIVYTKGQTATIGGVTYLAVYRPLFEGPGMMGLVTAATTGQTPDVPKLTADTTLSLSLLDMKNVGNLDDIRNFDLIAEVAESEKVTGNLQALVDMLQSAMKSSGSGSSETPAKQPAPAKKKPVQ